MIIDDLARTRGNARAISREERNFGRACNRRAPIIDPPGVPTVIYYPR